MRNQLFNVGVVLSVALIAQLPLSAQANYCWKDSYGRGVGTIPSDCSFSQEKQGLLCYQKCPAGYSGVGSICSQDCPAGYVNDGLFCRKPAAYGRGVGYAWQIQDGFANDGMLARCQTAEGRACEMGGAIAYPTCKPGFHTVGWNICSPDCPAKMTDIGISCTKPTSTRAPIVASCASNQVYDTGLCYSACKQGYVGTGPVCWGTCPSNKPIQCGAGCADSLDTCAQVTSDQVLSVVSMIQDIALDVLTGGIGTEIVEASKVAARTAAKTLAKTITKQAARDALYQAGKKAGKEIASTTLDTWQDAMVTYDTTSTASAAAGADPPDFDFTSLDPTGIASIVQAYNHTVCPAPPAGTATPGYAPTPTIPAPGIYTPPTTWVQQPGLLIQTRVTAGGTVWGLNSAGYFYRMRPGENNWTNLPGIATRIGAGGNSVWAVNSAGYIYRWNRSISNWDLMPGWASDVAVDADGNAFVIGKNSSIWEMKVGQYVWTPLIPLSASNPKTTPVHIFAGGHEKVFLVDNTGLDYQYNGPNPDPSNTNWFVWNYLHGAQISDPVVDIALTPDGELVELKASGSISWNMPGAVWFPPNTTDGVKFTSMGVGGPLSLWAVKSDGRIFKYVGSSRQ